MKVPETDRDNWDRHWAELGGMMQINPAVKFRWRAVRALLDFAAASRPIRFLDIGCGDGSFVADLCRQYPGIAVAGIDASEAGVTMARARLPAAVFRRVDLLAAESASVPELTGWASHALCSEVLEHLDDPAHFLRRAAPFLSPGATLVVTVPAGPRSALDRHIGHRKHYTPALLVRELTEAGFSVERVWRAGFPFYNLYRLLVVLRGATVVRESTSPVDANSRLTLLGLRLFDGLFAFNLYRSPFGWQLLARVKAPSGSAG